MGMPATPCPPPPFLTSSLPVRRGVVMVQPCPAAQAGDAGVVSHIHTRCGVSGCCWPSHTDSDAAVDACLSGYDRTAAGRQWRLAACGWAWLSPPGCVWFHTACRVGGGGCRGVGFSMARRQNAGPAPWQLCAHGKGAAGVCAAAGCVSCSISSPVVRMVAVVV